MMSRAEADVRMHIVMLRRGVFLSLLLLAPSIVGCLVRPSSEEAGGGAKKVEAAVSYLSLPESAGMVKCMYWNPDGVLYAGTGGGLFRVSFRDGGEPAVVSEVEDLSGVGVNSIASLGKDSLIAATVNGVARSDGGEWELEQIGNVLQVAPCSVAGGLLLGVSRGGLFVRRAAGGEWKRVRLCSFSDRFPSAEVLTSVAVSPDGVLVLGSEFGIHVFKPSRYRRAVDSLGMNASEEDVLKAFSYSWSHLYGDYQVPAVGVISDERGNCRMVGNDVRKVRYQDGIGFLVCTSTAVNILGGDGVWSVFTMTRRRAEMKPGGGVQTRMMQGNTGIGEAEVNDACLVGDHLYVATSFGLYSMKVARAPAGGWSPVEAAARLENGEVFCLEVGGGRLLAGGEHSIFEFGL